MFQMSSLSNIHNPSSSSLSQTHPLMPSLSEIPRSHARLALVLIVQDTVSGGGTPVCIPNVRTSPGRAGPLTSRIPARNSTGPRAQPSDAWPGRTEPGWTGWAELGWAGQAGLDWAVLC